MDGDGITRTVVSEAIPLLEPGGRPPTDNPLIRRVEGGSGQGVGQAGGSSGQEGGSYRHVLTQPRPISDSQT